MKSQKLLLMYGIALTTMARSTAEYIPITVHIKSGLPNNTEAMEIRCSSKSTSPEVRGLRAGEGYEWRVVKTRESHRCYSIWGRYFQSWHAFQPRRDEAHGDVYWLVKEDGFYLRWDRLLNWTRKAVWETD